ncbi:RES domain-containing protein [Caulobacter sp. LjRoot300]|uniref:RES domain-containing protein n=1 Tax=Caulobacter sp. LjRoot300 TaxID=3342321 RepID=UPI003ECE7CCF
MDVEGEKRLVCEDCIGEYLLKAEIAASGRTGPCMCCRGEEAAVVTLAWLADRVKPTYELLVTRAEEDIHFAGDRVWTAPNGQTSSELLADLIQADDRDVAVALIAIMGRGHRFDFAEGGLDLYGDENDDLAIEEPNGSALRRRWLEFCTALKHERRFFNAVGEGVLSEVFGPILCGEHGRDAVRVIGPQTADRFIYRARLANEDAGQATIFGRVVNELAAPGPGVSGAGRMNAAGISVFYGAFDIETCVAELRVPVGGAAVVGRFEVMRDLRILDLTRLAGETQAMSYFDPRYAQARAYGDFIEGFHAEIRRAVIPGRETLDYLPTQIVAEYLWSQANPPIDGIIFGSAQISQSANNIVLFPHAASVAGAQDEARRTIHGSYRAADHDEDAQVVGPLEQRVYFTPVAEPPPRRHAADNPLDLDDDWFSDFGSPPTLEPALRLLTDEISLVEVTGIHIDRTVIPVRFDTWKNPGF